MNRIKVPSGSIQKLESVFDTLQTKVQTNLVNNTNLWLNTGNLDIDVVNGVVNPNSTEFQILTSTTPQHPLRLVVRAGTLRLPNGEIVTIGTDYVFEMLGGVVANSYYAINLMQIELGTSPTPAQNAFLFDATGQSPYSTQNTAFQNTYYLEYALVTDTTIPQNALIDDRITLAFVKTGAGSELQETFNGSDGTPAVNGVIDFRTYYVARLKTNLFDDQMLVFKDRDSLGANKIDGSVEVRDDFIVGKDLTADGAYFTVTSGISLLHGDVYVSNAPGDGSGCVLSLEESTGTAGGGANLVFKQAGQVTGSILARQLAGENENL